MLTSKVVYNKLPAQKIACLSLGFRLNKTTSVMCILKKAPAKDKREIIKYKKYSPQPVARLTVSTFLVKQLFRSWFSVRISLPQSFCFLFKGSRSGGRTFSETSLTSTCRPQVPWCSFLLLLLSQVSCAALAVASNSDHLPLRERPARCWADFFQHNA